MGEIEYGVIHHSDTEPHREHMTEATARAWIAEFEEDGGKVGAFRVIRRTIGPWDLVDEAGPETLPQLFARARSLLGQQVRVTTDRGPTVAAGRFLAVADDGSFVIEDNMDGTVNYCWPMLHIEEETVGARIKREGEAGRRVLLEQMTAERDEFSAGKASPLLTSGGEPSSSPADRGAGASTTGAPTSWDDMTVDERRHTIDAALNDLEGTGFDTSGLRRSILGADATDG